jgi:sugar phosphate isomerase/epimerase
MNRDRRAFLRDSSLVLAGGALGMGGTTGLHAAAASPGPAAGSSKPELLASYWTIAGDVNPGTGGREWSLFDFRDRVEAISRAGFTGIGLWHSDLYHILETRSLADMRSILDDNGIVHVELEFLFDWFHPEGSERKKVSDTEKAKLLNAAEALGARHLKVGDFFNQEVTEERAAEAFAALCADAANAGTRILFEVMPFAMIDNLAGSVRMCEMADADNGGLMIDTWHIVKMRTPYAELADVPPRFLLGVELNDGFVQTPEGMDMNTETTQHRAFPGQGEFDMEGFMAAIAAAGYDGPYGVEVLNAKNRSRSLEELVSLTRDSAMAMFA